MVKPVVISGQHISFIISSDPNLFGWDRYLEMLAQHSVHLIVEFSTSLYTKDITTHFANHQIKVNWLPVQEGHCPTADVISNWFGIIDEVRKQTNDHDQKPGIALHCNSGFGRAPLMVCLALIHDGQTASSAIDIIRKHRPHALNQIQVAFLYDFEMERSVKIKKHSCSIQ
jgi:protein tyrosine phosphatase type 4A